MSGIQPQLWVERAAAAVVFYEAAFGARVLHRVGDGDDIVAQLAIGDIAFWVSPGGSGGPRFSPLAIGGTTGRTLLMVDEPDVLFARAVGADATPVSATRRWILLGRDRRSARHHPPSRTATPGPSKLTPLRFAARSSCRLSNQKQTWNSH